MMILAEKNLIHEGRTMLLLDLTKAMSSRLGS
jgi:hypothetical protein